MSDTKKIFLGVAAGALGMALLFGVVGAITGGSSSGSVAAQYTQPPAMPYTPAAAPAAVPESVPAEAPAQADPATSPTPTTIPGDGTFLVGSEVTPGTYRSSKAREPYCYASPASGLDGSGPRLNVTSFHGEPAIVTIKASDGSFQTSGCATWTRVK